MATIAAEQLGTTGREADALAAKGRLGSTKVAPPGLLLLLLAAHAADSVAREDDDGDGAPERVVRLRALRFPAALVLESAGAGSALGAPLALATRRDGAHLELEDGSGRVLLAADLRRRTPASEQHGHRPPAPAPAG
jgi:hypothetical protein